MAEGVGTLEPAELDDMICACESQEYVPYGRQYCTQHPGQRTQSQGGATAGSTGAHPADHGLPLVKALKDISIRDNVKVRLVFQEFTLTYLSWLFKLYSQACVRK